MDKPSHPLVIAHRGASGYRPENTFAAYELAIAQGADMIEVDLHCCADGAIAVLHDAALERIGGRGEVGEKHWAEMAALDAGGGERVPRLDQMLERFGAKIPFNLELKRPRRGEYSGLEAAALAEVQQRNLLTSTLFSSFDDPLLQRVRALAPAARIGLLVGPASAQRAVERALALGAEALHLKHTLVNRERVAEAHAAGLKVYVYTVNAEDDFRSTYACGADGFFSDFPDRARAVLTAISPYCP